MLWAFGFALADAETRIKKLLPRMNEKDKELIKTLAALLKKITKMFHFSTSIFHHHATVEEDTHINDVSHHAHKNVDFVMPETVNDSTGENAVHAVLKKENLANKEN